jgi:hypothetical protein
LRPLADSYTNRQKDGLTALFATAEHVHVEGTWDIYQGLFAAYREPDRAKGRELMTRLIESVSRSVPTVLSELTTLGRTPTHAPTTCWATATAPAPPTACSSTPMTFTASNREGSWIRIRLPSARTASLALFHTTPRPSAIGSTVGAEPRALPTRPQTRRDNFARGSAARVGSVPTHDHGPYTDGDVSWPPRSWLPTQRLALAAGSRSRGTPTAATATTLPVRFHNPARQHCTIWIRLLPSDFESELVEAAERGQVRASEGSVIHVEVFLTGSVRAFILG